MATRVKLVVSHRHNARTQVKMAQVDGCTFFRREDGWKHVDNHCKRIFHWLWTALIQIGECMLVMKDGTLAHQGKPCEKAAAYLATETKLEELSNAIIAEKDAAKKAEKEKELDLALEEFGGTDQPICLAQPNLDVIEVGGCVFTLDGDVYKHQCKENTSRCKLREHYEDLEGAKIRLTRKPGWDLEAFIKEAQAAIAQAVAQAPANPREHIFVEV